MQREVITREAAYVAGKTRFYTGVTCKRGHDAERYVSTGGCVECAVPYKFRRNSYDKRAVPFVTQALWVRNDYTTEERAALNAYLQTCIDTFDRSARPNDPPLMYKAIPGSPITPTSAPGARVAPSFDTLRSADRAPGRPAKCPHGVDEGYCTECSTRCVHGKEECSECEGA